MSGIGTGFHNGGKLVANFKVISNFTKCVRNAHVTTFGKILRSFGDFSFYKWFFLCVSK